jgi:hypothetical protein
MDRFGWREEGGDECDPVWTSFQSYHRGGTMKGKRRREGKNQRRKGKGEVEMR